MGMTVFGRPHESFLDCEDIEVVVYLHWFLEQFNKEAQCQRKLLALGIGSF